MKRLIASFAVLGLVAAPALAATTKPSATQAPAKPVKQHKVAKKGAKAAAANTKTSG